jgi:hypothetical protein
MRFMTEEGDFRPGHSHYNPVNVSDTVGAIVLGILSLILLLALLRAQARNRRLLEQLAAARQEAQAS